MQTDTQAIYDDFNAKLTRFIHKRVSDRDAAEDILQEVYLKIHASIGNLRDHERLESWVYQIARNAVIDHYRRARPLAELQEDLVMPETDEADAVSELAASTRTMLDCLPPDYRQALILTEVQGLTQQQLADRAGLSLSGAKSRVQRAREKLHAAYLDCCHFEFDRLGKIVAYHPRCPQCAREEDGVGSEH